MAVVRRTARAEDDLVDIWLYIAADNPDAADRLLEEIDRKCLLLASNPLLGRLRPDIARPSFGICQPATISSCIVVYRKESRSSPSSTAPDD
jgi:plasmid stabilization system protein ParE